MNMMLASVVERTREIGLRMAVGARQRDVQAQFLVESVMVCIFGGIAGVAASAAGPFAMKRILGWDVAIPSTRCSSRWRSRWPWASSSDSTRHGRPRASTPSLPCSRIERGRRRRTGGLLRGSSGAGGALKHDAGAAAVIVEQMEQSGSTTSCSMACARTTGDEVLQLRAPQLSDRWAPAVQRATRPLAKPVQIVGVLGVRAAANASRNAALVASGHGARSAV